MGRAKKSVSVVVPLYGNPHLDRFNLVSESIFAQRNVSLELILAGLNTAQRFSNLSQVETPKEAVPSIVRMGSVLNRGLNLAAGELTYVTDADILLVNPEYLANLIQESCNQGSFLKRPPMRRLLLQDFDWFNSLVKNNGLEKALDLLDFSQDYIVKPKDQKRNIRAFKKLESGRIKTFIATGEDLQRYRSSEENKGSEPLYFNQEIHCGAVFAPTQAFSDVGGYSEGFVSWGVWDADIQWKLEHIGDMNLIPKERRFDVIHLDHSKEYFNKDKWAQDRLLQIKRRESGAEECIKEDREEYGGKYAI